jgi:hypothetical protein
MAEFYAKGKINLTRLDELLDKHPHLVTENESGELELKVNINFYAKPFENGKNMKICLFEKRGVSYPLGYADVDHEMFKRVV